MRRLLRGGLASLVMVAAFGVHGQDIAPMPPAALAPAVAWTRYTVLCSNGVPVETNFASVARQQTPVNHLELTWTAPASPGVICYRVYRSATINPPHWTLYGSTTIDAFLADATNGGQAFYAVESVNTAGVMSRLP